MAFALVGSAGAFTAAAASITPAFGTGETRATGNLLICVCGLNAATIPSITAGWNVAASALGASHATVIYYKVAAGSDAAPTLTTSGPNGTAALAEFSGNAGSPLDQNGGNGAASSPVVAVSGAPDAAAGELIVYGVRIAFSTSPTITITDTLNNGASPISLGNSGLTTNQNPTEFGYGITTGNSVADQDSAAPSPTTNLTDMAVAIASFKLAALPSILTTDILYRLSGGASNTAEASSIGGAMSTIAGGLITGGAQNNVWNDVGSSESTSGSTKYRCWYVQNNHATVTWQNVRVWVDGTPADGSTSIALDPAGVSGTALTLADENDSTNVLGSNGVTFSGTNLPNTKGTGLVIGNLAPGAYQAVWRKRVIPSSATAQTPDAMSVRAEGETP